jgi:rod shape-determining protein MreC
MALPDIRQRAGTLFLVVAVGHLILISAQVNSRAGVPLLEVAVFGVFSEIQRAASGTVGAIDSVWRNYVGLRQAARENEDLRRRVAALQLALQEERVRSERSARLEALLQMPARRALQTVGADVIGGGVTPDVRTVTIDKGSRDGLHEDMAVLSAAGVVGRVTIAGAHASEVQLLVDRNAAAAALVARTREEGVVVGTGENLLRMDYVASSADVQRGDDILTAGIDGIYPKGLVIGKVESVEKAAGSYKAIRVRPAVAFSALEEVLVVVSPVARVQPREGPE